jgi:putative DNA primase/helicase
MADREVAGNVETAEPVEETYFETIQRLAALPTHEYERCRKAEAKRLDMRVAVLDKNVRSARPKDDEGNDLGLFEPEPWPEEVDGDDLVDRIVAGLRRHVVMPDHAAEATALWVLHCYCFDIWHHTPRLRVSAPEKGCGKSTLLDVLACLVPRALATANLSTATAFRAIDQFHPSLLIDEFDTFLRDNPELVGALNAGHAKGRSHLRCEGDDNRIRGFNTFGRAALAGIGNLPPTLADRSVSIVLQKRRPDEYVQDFREDRVDHLRELASQATRWTEDHRVRLGNHEPAMPEGIHNRLADNWRGLLAIADIAGGGWPERARVAAIALCRGAGDDAESRRVQLLADIRDIFDGLGEDRVPSKLLVERLHAKEDRPWSEYGKSARPISVAQVARLLKPFAISPGTIRWGAETPKGYRLDFFKEAFARYLPPVQNATTPQPAENCGESPISKRHKEDDVAFTNPPKPAESVTCGVVAARNGGVGDERCFDLDFEGEGDAEERAAIQAIDGEKP